MRNKLKYIILIICSIFFITGFSLWAINYYLYSWTTQVNLLFPCTEKHIWIRDTSKGSKGEIFDDYLDLNRLADKVRLSSSNYNVILNDGYLLNLRRLFNGKVYSLTFKNDDKLKTTKFSFSGGLSGENEDCSVPDYYILQNAYQFINDLPLTETQKKKLRDNLRVMSPIKLSIG